MKQLMLGTAAAARNPTGKIEKPKLRQLYRTEDPFAVMKQ